MIPTDEGTSSALPPDDNPDDALDYDVIRSLESHNNCFLCDSKDHRIATWPQLTRIKGKDLAMCVCVAAIGPSRDSCPNDRPPRKDACPRQDAILVLTVNPWSRLFVRIANLVMKGS
jgi:hypothetical protein